MKSITPLRGSWVFAAILLAGSALGAAPPEPHRAWSIADYGANADGKTLATPAIQAAIDAAASAGGGRVVIPAGTYLTAPIQMRDGIDLHLETGATLLFSKSYDDYPLAWIDDGSGNEPGVRSPIWGDQLHDISITGSGTLDGQGRAWRQLKKTKSVEAAWADRIASGGVLSASGGIWYPSAIVRDGRAEFDKLRSTSPPLDAYAKFRPLFHPNLVRLTNCQRITLEGVTFRESAFWNLHLALCDDIHIHAINEYNPIYAQNGDGIDLDSCRNVTIEDSTFNAGDDGICLKSGKDLAGRKRGRPTENVTITHCTVGTGHGGVVIGSEMSGGVRNVTVRDCTFNGTDAGLRFKSKRGRGGAVENVDVRGIHMTDIHGPAILFDMFYESSSAASNPTTTPVNEGTPAFSHFVIRDITCDGAKRAFQLHGLPERPLDNLTFEHINITADDAGVMTDATDITLRDVHVKAADGGSVKIRNLANVTMENTSGIEK